MTQKEISLEKKRKILSVAKYIIEMKATIEMTANHFGLSKSTIKKYINDENNLKKIDENLYLCVKQVQQELEYFGHVVGGKNGIRTASITEFESLEIAEKIIRKKMTIEQASDFFQIPTSTLYENIRKINDISIQEELDKVFSSPENKIFKGKNR